MSNTTDKLIEQTSGVLEKTYDDIVHPSAKSVGNTLSLIPRTIGVWLGKWEKWVINGEESVRLTALAVREKASQIPEEKLTEPEPYVVIPAIQQLGYCYDSEELRNMYANLLVASMNTEIKGQVHPSYVDIIKQLSPDEAKLLKSISTNRSHPIIDVHLLKANGNYELKVHNFTNIAEGVCEHPENIFSYIDNFVRLGLIEIPDKKALTDDALYEPLMQHKEIVAFTSKELPEGQSFKVVKRIFDLTMFGINFIKVCVL